MTKTQCNKCIFADTVSSNSPCEFHIPEKIKDIKNVSIIDDFYEIENYRCLYGFSKNQYDQNIDNLKDVDIRNLAKDKASLKYYLILDARQISKDQLYRIIDDIDKLDTKPTHLSIIISPNDPDPAYEYVRHNLSCRKWTIHVFIETLSLNDCINTILDTNLIASQSWCLLFIDANSLDKKIQDVISFLQDNFIIKQKNFYGVKYTDSLHMMCLNCMVYKTLVSTIDRDIIKSLESTTEITLETYEI
jgi:hypothetical protein